MLSISIDVVQLSPTSIRIDDESAYGSLDRSDVVLTVELFKIVSGQLQALPPLIYNPTTWSSITVSIPDGKILIRVCAEYGSPFGIQTTEPIPIENIKAITALWEDEIEGNNLIDTIYSPNHIEDFVTAINAAISEGEFFSEIQDGYVVFGFSGVTHQYVGIEYLQVAYPGNAVQVPFAPTSSGVIKECIEETHIQIQSLNKCYEKELCRLIKINGCPTITDIEKLEKLIAFKRSLVEAPDSHFNNIVEYAGLYCKKECKC